MRRLAFFTLIIFFPLLSSPGRTISGKNHTDAEAQIKAVRDRLNRIKPFQVQFVQQVYSDEELDIEESGEILFKDDRRLRWTYLEPDTKVFLLLEDEYKFYDEENEQLTVGKIKDRSRQWIWQLFFSDDILRYIHTDPVPDKTRKKIYIKKEDSDEPLDIEILLNTDSLPVQVIQADPDTGVRMIFYFKDYKAKVKLPGDAFEINVPADTVIINE